MIDLGVRVMIFLGLESSKVCINELESLMLTF